MLAGAFRVLRRCGSFSSQDRIIRTLSLMEIKASIRMRRRRKKGSEDDRDDDDDDESDESDSDDDDDDDDDDDSEDSDEIEEVASSTFLPPDPLAFSFYQLVIVLKLTFGGVEEDKETHNEFVAEKKWKLFSDFATGIHHLCLLLLLLLLFTKKKKKKKKNFCFIRNVIESEKWCRKCR